MNKYILKLGLLGIILLGALFVMLIDQGSGLDSPGFWLIPLGVIGSMGLITREKGLSRVILPGVFWLLAFLFIIALLIDIRYQLVFEGFDILTWILLAIPSALIGFVLLAYRLIKT